MLMIDLDGGEKFLRHPEIGLHRIDGLEIDQRLTGGDLLADAHMAQSDVPENGATICAFSSCTRANSTAAVLTARFEADSSAD